MNESTINKIVIFSPLPPPEGGISSWTSDYINYALNHHLNVKVINSNLVGKSIAHHEKRFFVSEIKRIIHIKRQIKSNRPYTNNTVIHFNTSCSILGMFRDYFLFFSFFKKCKIVLNCHCDISIYLKSKKHLWIFKKIAKKSSLILLLNERSVRFLENHNIIIPHRYFPNCIDNAKIPHRTKLYNGINDIAFVGHVRKSKGFEIVVECAKKFSEKTFHIFGQIPEDFKNPNLKNLIFYEAIPKNELFKKLTKCDALLMPSLAEGFSISLIECVSIGLFIISSPAGAAPQVLKNTSNIVTSGYMVDDFIKAIEKASTYSNDFLKHVSEQNIELGSKYDTTIIFKNLFDLYEGLF